jgi:hypothetical protein
MKADSFLSRLADMFPSGLSRAKWGLALSLMLTGCSPDQKAAAGQWLNSTSQDVENRGDDLQYARTYHDHFELTGSSNFKHPISVRRDQSGYTIKRRGTLSDKLGLNKKHD